MDHKKRVRVRSAVLLVLTVVLFITSVIDFRLENKKVVTEDTKEHLLVSTRLQSQMIDALFQSRLRFIENLGTMLENVATQDKNKIAACLEDITDNTQIDAILLYAADGSLLCGDERNSAFTDNKFFLQALAGNSGMVWLQEEQDVTKNAIAYYTPVTLQNQAMGVLVGINYYSYYDEVLASPENEETMIGYLLDAGQHRVLMDCHDMRYDYEKLLQEWGSMDADGYQNYMDVIENHRTEVFPYRGPKGEGMMSVVPICIENCFLVQVYQSGQIKIRTDRLNMPMLFLELSLLLCFLNLSLMVINWLKTKWNRSGRLSSMYMETLSSIYPRMIYVDLDKEEVEIIQNIEHPETRELKPLKWAIYKSMVMEEIYPEDREKIKNFLTLDNFRFIRDKKLNGGSGSCTYRKLSRGEYLWYQAVVVPSNRKGNGVVIYARNSDAVTQAEEYQKSKLLDRVEQAKRSEMEKNEYMRYFTNVLITPLDAITGLSAITKDSSVYGNMVYVMGNYVKMLFRDIDQIVLHRNARLATHTEVFRLNQMMQGISLFCEEIYKKEMNIHFTMGLDERLQDLYEGDKYRLLQILDVLITNAYQYNRKDGMVRLSVDLLDRTESEDKLFLSVEDNGRGMSKEFQTIVFDLFAREKPSGYEEKDAAGKKGGPGVGLYLAKKAVEAMNGTISLESVPGQGSKFSVVVSLRRVKPEEMGQVSSRQRVLVVDDNQLMAELMAETLTVNGYEAEYCVSGERAIQTIKESNSSFDFILTDIIMPGMDGRALLRILREQKLCTPNCRIIAISSVANKETDCTEETGFDGYILKPFNMKEWNEVIRKVR